MAWPSAALLPVVALVTRVQSLQLPVDDKQYTAWITTYHKTGTVLVKDVRKNCLPGTKVGTVDKQLPTTTDSSVPVVQFVRDPSALIVSAYFYHLQGPEDWTLTPMTSAKWKKFQSDPKLMGYFDPRLSYSEFLQKLNISLGVRAEYLRSTGAIEHMMSDWDICRNADWCKKFCLESFTESSVAYNLTWQRVLSFLHEDAKHLDCISKYDQKSPNYQGSTTHQTSLSTPAEKIAEAAKIVLDYDNEIGEGVMQYYGQKIQCSQLGPKLVEGQSPAETWATIEAYA